MASERVLPMLREDGVAIPIFVCTRTVYFFAIVRHPFFIVGQREVALFKLPKVSGFGRQTRRFQQFCVFGRFRTILLCCEHETSPFPPGGSSTGLSVTGAGSDRKSVMKDIGTRRSISEGGRLNSNPLILVQGEQTLGMQQLCS